MLHTALIIAGILGFSVPQLSRDSATLLVQHYFKDNPPIVYIWNPEISSDPQLLDPLEASGLFSLDPVQTLAPGQIVMCAEPPSAHLTPRGIEVAMQRRWQVRLDGYDVVIPLGSFS